MLTIYGAPPSIHTRKVIVTALEKNLDYKVEVVFPFDPPDGWLALSPTGRIPALSDGDFHVADSSVIVAYLERRYEPASLLPDDAPGYAHALWFEEYVDGEIAPLIVALFREKILGPMQGCEPDPAVLEGLITKLVPCFDYLDGNLGDGYLAGEAFSIADIAVASNLVTYHYLGYRLDEARHGRLCAHFGRTLARPSFLKALAAERPFTEKLGLDSNSLPAVGQGN